MSVNTSYIFIYLRCIIKLTTMIGLLTGFALALLCFTFYRHLQKNNLKLKWFQWLSVMGCVILAAFTSLMIESFILEGAYKAALVMGSVFGIISIIYAILIIRLFLIKPLKANSNE